MSNSSQPAIAKKNGPRRWHEQRWIIDSVLRTDGLEWDQPRIAYTLRPMGLDGNADFALALSRINKFDDLVPVFRDLADRRRRLGEEALAADRKVTAREHFFHAAVLYSTAEWSIWKTTPELVALDDAKNAAYKEYAKLADHHVERVEIPFGDGYLPAWYHRPVGTGDESLPLLLSCGGMDQAKELNVSMYGDKFLERGFAILAFDGPGQGEAPIRGTDFTPTAWIDAGEALFDWARGRDDVDEDQIVGYGLSFGSYWMTQIAASQPTMRGAAVGLVCHEPGGHGIFEAASPSFKARFMWMSGLEEDETAFDEMVQQLDLREQAAGMTVPWLVVAGDADELSPIEHSYDLAEIAGGPSPLLVYAQGRHALSQPTPSVVAGPNWFSYAADWLLDRLAGVPAENTFDYVTATGVVESRPHPKNAKH
ncbi:alpha/beta hydrolase family protein [Glaciibacter superstes]|uniref:alpha/beta hydrolase family protein n=1 Tax=Glaciibacter superstes TaxID=501023 RepID=UPI0003B75854|nr:alpha/beta hydrolase [Glaciibacter superstes]